MRVRIPRRRLEQIRKLKRVSIYCCRICLVGQEGNWLDHKKDTSTDDRTDTRGRFVPTFLDAKRAESFMDKVRPAEPSDGS